MASPSTHKDKKNASVEKDKLFFTYLPGFAEFILKNKLEEYSREQLKYSFEEEVPLMKFLAHLSEDELLALAIEGSREFLTVLAENRSREYIEKSSADFIKNRINIIEREQVVAEDITIVSFIRRKTLRKLLTSYSNDWEEFMHVMEEVDRFVAESETSSFNAFIKIQQENIARINSALEQRQEDLLEAQELADLGSFLWDMKHGNSVFTPGVMKIFELEEKSNLEAFMTDVHEDDRDMLKKALQKALEKDGLYECEYRLVKNGNEKMIWSRGIVQFEDGKAISMKGTVMDVTGKYSLLAQLQESEKANKLAQSLTHMGTWVWDITTNRISWSDEMYRIYGLEPQSEITFDRYISMIHPDDRDRRLSEIKESLKTGEVKDYLIHIVTPAGITKVLKGKGELKRDKKNAPLTLNCTCQDITLEYKLNQELQEKEEYLQAKTLLLEKLNLSLEVKNNELSRINKELESFNYIASHDLQEPLRKIQTFIQLILEKSKNKLPSGTMEYFNKIMTSSSRMKLLIEDLLMFSQTTANEDNFELSDLNHLLDEVKIILSTLIEEKKAVIESRDLPTLRVIPFQIQQLLLNLISNAIKYSKENTIPRIKISSRVVTGDQIGDSGAIAGKDYFELQVKDNGIGFDEENSERIFGLFQRLHNKDKYSGTGIGLAICKKIVHNHNGFIKARSEVGKGSVFYVYLPRTDKKTSYLVN